jgi:hypothetical protein
MWFEEGLQSLSDARLALTFAVRAYGHGFPSPPTDGLVDTPGALLLQGEPSRYDPATVERACMFRYHIDDAVIRTSATFEKVAGLLGSYYSIDFRNKTELYSKLRSKWPQEILVKRLQDIRRSAAFREGQDYRNPRIHSLGASFRALYGGRPEISESLVACPGIVLVKPRRTVAADQLFRLAKAFYRAAARFTRGAARLIEAHPLRFTREDPFVARRIQRPALHRDVDENKMPVELTDEFCTKDQRIYCTALVHSAKGRVLKIRWYLGNRLKLSQDTLVGDDQELKATACMEADPGQAFRPAHGLVQWWLDDELIWKMRFRIVEAAPVGLAATQE